MFASILKLSILKTRTISNIRYQISTYMKYSIVKDIGSEFETEAPTSILFTLWGLVREGHDIGSGRGE